MAKDRQALWQAILGAIRCSEGWLVLLGLSGIFWKPCWVMLPLFLGLALTICRIGTLRHELQSKPVQAAAVALGLGVFSQLPAWGWDFCYQWGLKAKVFASFGGFDAAWLANPQLAFANPQYPPLWPTLVSFGMAFGVSAENAAGFWTALLRVGLASTFWSLASAGGWWKRWLAAASAVFAPVLFRPFFFGYAEPLVAFLLAAVVTVVAGKQRLQPGWSWLHASLLGLAKVEGLLWLTCLAAASWKRSGGRYRLAFALSCVPATAWFFWLQKVALGKSPLDLRWGHLGARLFSLPGALLVAGTEPLLATLVFGLAVFAGWGSTPLPRASLGFAFGLAVVYLAGPHPLPWWLANSLVRVLAVPVPALLASALVSERAETINHRNQPPA